MSNPTDFLVAHASAPKWQDAAAEIILELKPLTTEHRLGFLYVTDAFADSLKEISLFLRQTTGVPHWVGTVGFGICAPGKEYFGEAAMAAVCRNTSAMGGAAATPQPQLLDHPIVQAIAERRGCGSAEVLLLWALQQEPPVPVIPKSVSPERISANAAVRRAVPLSDSDMQMLDRLENGHKFAWDPSAVD